MEQTSKQLGQQSYRDALQNQEESGDAMLNTRGSGIKDLKSDAGEGFLPSVQTIDAKTRRQSRVSASMDRRASGMRYGGSKEGKREIFHLRESDRGGGKLEDRLNESHTNSFNRESNRETHGMYLQSEDPSVTIEKLKKKSELQKKIIQELDAKVQEGLLREENLRYSIDQSTAGKYELMRREMEKLRAQNIMLQKEISNLTQKLKTAVGYKTTDRAAKIEALLKQREKDIETLVLEKKSLEKTKRDQDKAIVALKQDRDYFAKATAEYVDEIQNLKKNQIGSFKEDIATLKDQLKEYQKRAKADEKFIKQQALIIATLDVRQKEFCDKVGITLNPLLDQQKREELFKAMSYHQKNFLRSSKNAGKVTIEDTWLEALESSDEEEGGGNPNIPLAERHSRLQNKYSGLKRAHHIMERKLKGEIEFLIRRLNDVELRLREKEKENQILSEKLFDLRARKHNLTPIPKKEKLDGSINISVIPKKEQKAMHLIADENSKFLENELSHEGPKEIPQSSQTNDLDSIREIEKEKRLPELDERAQIIKENSHSQKSTGGKVDELPAEKAHIKRDYKSQLLQRAEEEEAMEDQKNIRVREIVNSFKGENEENKENKLETVAKEQKSDKDEAHENEISDEKENGKLEQNELKTSDSGGVKEKSNKSQGRLENMTIQEQSHPKQGSFGELANQRTIGRILPGDIMFDDKEGIGDKISTKIHKIEVWHHEESITGIQVTYQLSDGSLFQGKRYLDLRTSEQEYQEPWVFDKEEHIVKVIGRYSEDCGIEKLSIFTNKGVSRDYGNLNSAATEFVVDFEERWPPICVYGCRRLINYEDKPDRTVISGLGFKTKSDEKKRWASRTQL